MENKVVKSWTTKAGLKAVIVKCGYGEDTKASAVSIGIATEWHCGYVQISEDHKLYGVNYNDTYKNDNYFEVHGGLTYSGEGAPSGEFSGPWWFGFDCAHYNDNIINCNEEYVTNECEKLAEQLKE